MMIIIFYREHLVNETSNTSGGETYGGTRLRMPKQSVGLLNARICCKCPLELCSGACGDLLG